MICWAPVPHGILFTVRWDAWRLGNSLRRLRMEPGWGGPSDGRHRAGVGRALLALLPRLPPVRLPPLAILASPRLIPWMFANFESSISP